MASMSVEEEVELLNSIIVNAQIMLNRIRSRADSLEAQDDSRAPKRVKTDDFASSPANLAHVPPSIPASIGEISPSTAEKNLKGRLAEAVAVTYPSPGDDEEVIRCICNEYDPNEERTMICCDKCQVWQHNDCMGLHKKYDLPTYFCQKCRPGNHKGLLDAIKRGEKPWVDAARRRVNKRLAQGRK